MPQKINFTVKKMHKNCCKQSCSFWLRYQPNRSAAGASHQTPLGELTELFQTYWMYLGGLLLRDGREVKGIIGRKEKGTEEGDEKEGGRRRLSR